MTASILELQDVEATYDHAIIALRGVSLNVGPGEIVALLGANGAGKTTTLRALSNLLGAERGQLGGGTILLDGKPIQGRSPAELVAQGLVQVLEGRHVFRSLTVEENLITGALCRRPSRRALNTALDRVYRIFPRLQERRRHLAGLTSGGEQQMVAIGRALMSEPRLLVLDEPSMGLAPLLVEGIYRTLLTLNREQGLSLLIAEQNSAVALRHAHRAYVLDNGQTELSGTAAELRRRDDIKAFYLGQGSHVGVAA